MILGDHEIPKQKQIQNLEGLSPNSALNISNILQHFPFSSCTVEFHYSLTSMSILLYNLPRASTHHVMVLFNSPNFPVRQIKQVK